MAIYFSFLGLNCQFTWKINCDTKPIWSFLYFMGITPPFFRFFVKIIGPFLFGAPLCFVMQKFHGPYRQIDLGLKYWNIFVKTKILLIGTKSRDTKAKTRYKNSSVKIGWSPRAYPWTPVNRRVLVYHFKSV